jgi:hypothetical protein
MRWRLGISGDMVLLNDGGGILVNVRHDREFSFKSIGSSLKRLRRLLPHANQAQIELICRSRHSVNPSRHDVNQS